jgi:hypothetical protein
MFKFRTIRSLLLGAAVIAFSAATGALHAATVPPGPTPESVDPARR